MAAGRSPTTSAPGRRALRRRLAAAAALSALLALVACDVWVVAVRDWWDRHAFTSCVVSSLLVVAVTVLVVDEVIARRQRDERAVSVAVQSVIVYGQALRSYEAVRSGFLATGAGDDAQVEAMREEVRSLASMILVASPQLFDDPEARRFLEAVQRLAGVMFAAASQAVGSISVAASREAILSRLAECRSEVGDRIGTLAGRLPLQDREPFGDGLGGPQPDLANAAVGKA